MRTRTRSASCWRSGSAYFGIAQPNGRHIQAGQSGHYPLRSMYGCGSCVRPWQAKDPDATMSESNSANIAKGGGLIFIDPAAGFEIRAISPSEQPEIARILAAATGSGT